MNLKIGHYECPVLPFDPGKAIEADQNGLYDTTNKTIHIDSALTPVHQAEILLHEIIHAAWDAYGWVEPMTEENCCSMLSKALAAILQANPNLAPTLMLALLNKKAIVK
jgi:hypothetical protein